MEAGKQIAKNIFISNVLALQEWYFAVMEGNVSQLDKKHYNELMRPLDRYLRRLNSKMDENAETYLEANKEYLINCIQSLYDEQCNQIKNEK